MSDNLCMACSLCCNGTLFARVPILKEEAERLGDQVEVFSRGGNLRMRLPCPQLSDEGTCGIYHSRPTDCQSYRCQLLKRNERRAISDQDARDIVNELHELQDKAKSAALKATPASDHREGRQSAAQAMQTLKIAYEDPSGAIDKYLYRNAEFHFETFVRYVRMHLQPNFRKGK